MTGGRLLLDSCVVIDYLRQRPEAVAFIESLTEPPHLSSLVIGETYAGIREGFEREQFESLISGCQVVPLTVDVAVAGGLLARQYRPSHNVGLFDALIAATATSLGAQLVTCDVKHFPRLPNLVKPY